MYAFNISTGTDNLELIAGFDSLCGAPVEIDHISFHERALLLFLLCTHDFRHCRKVLKSDVAGAIEGGPDSDQGLPLGWPNDLNRWFLRRLLIGGCIRACLSISGSGKQK